MAKLKPIHYEWLARSIREIESRRGMPGNAGHSNLDNPLYMKAMAEMWADECKGTNPAFNRDRFISAVVNGEW